MLTILLPLIIGLCLQWIVFSEKDKRAESGRYTLNRVWYAVWIVCLWFLVIIMAGIASMFDGAQLSSGFLIWYIWQMTVIPTVMRRLWNIGWSPWWVLLLFIPFTPLILAPFILCFIRGQQANGLAILPYAYRDGETLAMVVKWPFRECWKCLVAMRGDPQVSEIPCPKCGGPMRFPGKKTGATGQSSNVPVARRQSASMAEMLRTKPVPNQDLSLTPPRKKTTKISLPESAVATDVVQTHPINKPRQPPPLPKTRAARIGPITFSQNGQVFGPYELAVVVNLWDQGQIVGNALYWHDRLDDWKSLVSDVESLRKMAQGMS